MATIIKSFECGDGDTFYINHGSGTFTIIDCNLCDNNKDRIIDEIINEIEAEKSENNTWRFISTHPREDHYKGIEHLHRRKPVSEFYCVKNSAVKEEDESFSLYKKLRDGNTAKYLSSTKFEGLGDKGISILWPDTENSKFQEALKRANKGEKPHNISPIILYSMKNGADVLWFGDLEQDFMELIKNDVKLPKADIVFTPHHGRRNGRLPQQWLNDIKPNLIVLGEGSTEDLDYYYYRSNCKEAITQNRAEDIMFDCGTGWVDLYTTHDGSGYKNRNWHFRDLDRKKGLNYIGSLKTRR